MNLNFRKTALLAGICSVFSLGYAPQLFAVSSTDTVEAVQQTKKITGVVSDAMGPIIGANVLEKGTTNGVITDIDGNFALNVKPGATIVVSFIGYVSQEIKITNQTTVNITLKEDSEMLDEVVVVGYGTMKKSDLSGASVSMSEDKIKGSIITNLDQSLQGRAAGVTAVSTSGAPGSSSSIRVRGQATINANAEPLYVIDGVIVQSQGQSGSSYGLGDALGNGSVSTISPLSTINPADIVSMEILKDASATAIYGAQGSNGVVLITTKRGKSGKPRINYNGYVSIQNPTMLQDLMSSYDYARLYDKARVEYGLEPRFDKVGDGKIYEKFRDGSDPYNYPNTDWYDLAYRTGFQHNHNVNVSGGTDNLKYMASVGYLHQDGTLPNAERQQFNGRMNLDVKLNSRLNVRVNMAYINNDYSEPNSSYGGSGSGQIVMRLGKMAPWIVGRYEDGTWRTFSDGSPLAWLDVDQTVRRENQNFSGTLSADYKIVDGLVATLTGSYVNNQQHYKAFQKFIQYNEDPLQAQSDPFLGRQLRGQAP